MYRIVVCDDEPAAAAEIGRALQRIAAELGSTFQIDTYHSGEALVTAPLDNTDLLFLDIQMGQLSGMEAAKLLRRQYPELCLVFLTSMVHYALEGYEVHPFGFLAKPVTYTTLKEKTAEALAWLQQRKGTVLTFKNGSETYRIREKDILYIDILDHKARVVTATSEAVCYTTLSQLETQLNSRLFFRCHKSFLVNLSAVQSIGVSAAVLHNGDTVPVSKHRRAEFLSAFARFMREPL